MPAPSSQSWTTAPGLMRALGGFALIALGMLLGLVALGLLLLDVAPVRQAALSLALAEINKGETKIAIGGIEGSWPDRLILRDVAVSDAQGPWLTLDSAELDWRPSALLGGELHIVNLLATKLSVPRGPVGTTPSTGSTSGTSSFALPVLPVAIRIDAARFDGVTLGRALAEPKATGLLARFDADARLALSAGRLDLTLKGARTDGVPGTIDLQALVDQRHKLVTLQLAAEDGAADKPGLVATLGHVAGAARTTLAADVRNVDGAVNGTVRIDGGKAVKVQGSAQGYWNADLDLDVTASAEGDLIADMLSDFGRARAAHLAGKVQWLRDDTLTFSGLTIDAGVLALTGDVHLGTASVAAPHALTAQGTLAGLDRLLDKSGNAALSPLGWRLAGQVDMASGIAHLTDATVAATPGEARFTGDAGFDGSVKGAGEIAVKDAAPLGALIGQRLAGRMDLKLTPFAIDAQGVGSGDFTIETDSIDIGDARLNRLVGGTLAIDGSLLLPKGGGIALPSLTVTPASGAYHFRATVSQGVTGLLSGEAKFDAGNAAALLPDEASGAFSADATLSGSLAKPRLKLAAKLADGSVAGVAARLVTLDVVAASGAAGPLALRFDGPRGKAALDASLVLPGAGGARLDALTADIFGARLAGALAVSPDGLVSGALKGEHVPLKPFSDLAGMPLDGAGDLTVAADAAGGKQNATLAFTARRLDVDPGIAVALDHVTLDATLRDLTGKAEIDAKLSALSGQSGITHLTHVAATAAGPLAKLALTADIGGMRESITPQPFTFATEATLNGSALTVARLRLALGDASLALASPARLDFANGIAAKGLAFDIGGASGKGRLSADMDMTGRAVRLHADGKTVPLDLATLLMPVDSVEGTASGTVDLDSGRGTGALAMRFGKVILSQEAEGERPAFDAAIDGKWAKGRFDVTARAQGVSTKPFELVASLPVTRDPKGAWPMPAARGPVSGRLTWDGPIASLAALTDIGNQQITGEAQVALTADGDISAPRISGNAGIANGTYENFDSGTLLKKLSLKLEGSRSQSLHFTLDANDGGQGKVAADGSVSLAPTLSPAISIKASFDDAHLVRRSDADVSVDGTVELSGQTFPPGAEAPLALKGALTTTNVQIRIPDSLSASIPQIDVVEINGPSTFATPAEAASVVPLQLDVGIKIGKPARISGRGLDSLWTGELQVSGPATEPDVTGTLTSLRGALDFAGKTFTLSKGEVRFLGETPINPNLDIALDYKRSDLAATVAVTGQSSSPNIALSSTPDLPRDELLSRILFNKGVGELSATEAVQLANTLAQLSGTGLGVSGAGILDRVQQSLGLDVLRIDSAQSGATTLSAGKYVDKNVYVGVEQGALASDSSVKVEITVTPQISVDTRIGQNASGDVGINWKWDY